MTSNTALSQLGNVVPELGHPVPDLEHPLCVYLPIKIYNRGLSLKPVENSQDKQLVQLVRFGDRDLIVGIVRLHFQPVCTAGNPGSHYFRYTDHTVAVYFMESNLGT